MYGGTVVSTAGGCIFSLSLCGFPPGAPFPFHSPLTCRSGEMGALHCRCDYKCACVVCDGLETMHTMVERFGTPWSNCDRLHSRVALKRKRTMGLENRWMGDVYENKTAFSNIVQMLYQKANHCPNPNHKYALVHLTRYIKSKSIQSFK